MTPRRRNWILLWVSLIGIVFFLRLWPVTPAPPFSWAWQEVATGPFDDLPQTPPASLLPVRLLGSSPGATYGVELLSGLGLLGVGAGPPPSHANARREVLVVPSERCSGGEALRAHLQGGGALVLLAPCEALRRALDIPAPTQFEDPAPEASADLSPGRRARNLPLPQVADEWVGPSGWEALVRRVGGGVVAMQRGRMVVFSFDLVGWLRQLRQGDPTLANVDSDGQHGLKPNDLRPFPWSGLSWRQPSGDIWCELLAWVVGERLQDHPLPRLSPSLPGARSALVLTMDQDFAPPEWIDPMLARAEAAGGEATLLTTLGTRQRNDAPADGEGGTLLSGRQLRRAWAWGHGIGAHPNPAGLADPRRAAEAIALQRGRLQAVLPPGDLRVVRHHYLRWWGHDAPMQGLADLGYWMELNFVSIEPRMRGPGFQFGSGRPARWQLADGRLLPLLSQPTEIEDDVLIGDLPYSARLSQEQAALASANLMDAGILWGVPVVANLHPMIFAGQGGVLFDGLLAAARERGLPIISAERWATWSWARLRAAQGAVLHPTPSGWSVEAPPAPVPLELYSPGGACEAPVTASPLVPPGCLTPWGG